MFLESLKHISAGQMFQEHGSKTTQTGKTDNLRGHREVRHCSAGSALTISSQPSRNFSAVLKALALEKSQIFFVISVQYQKGNQK